MKSVNTICNEIYVEMRKISKHLEHSDVMLRVNPEVAKALKANNARLLNEMEELTKKTDHREVRSGAAPGAVRHSLSCWIPANRRRGNREGTGVVLVPSLLERDSCCAQMFARDGTPPVSSRARFRMHRRTWASQSKNSALSSLAECIV